MELVVAPRLIWSERKRWGWCITHMLGAGIVPERGDERRLSGPIADLPSTPDGATAGS
jgi:hypothetical protein